jgi:hypothetical protein
MRWRSKMNRDDEALFEIAAGGLLRQLGYPLTGFRTLSSYYQWGRARTIRAWRSAKLRTKVTIYRALHGS